eukprot:3597200-Lingulodinium_polyedra.AAC.1
MNFHKFPVFEDILMVLSFIALSGSLRVVANGRAFCARVSPVGSFRSLERMGREIPLLLLYQAFLPT